MTRPFSIGVSFHTPRHGSRWRGYSGFTLVEVLFVAALIAVMATVASVSYFGLLRGAREREGKVYMALYEDNVTTYMGTHVVFNRADFDAWADMTRRLKYYQSEGVLMSVSNGGPLENDTITLPARDTKEARTIESRFIGGQWVKSYLGS